MSSIGSIGSGSNSFWQDDQTYWSNVQTQNQAQTASTSLITAMGTAMTNKAKGLASISNQVALSRVNAQLTAALQSAIQSTQAASSSNSTASTKGSPATGTGTVPLTKNTSLLTLGIVQNGTITVTAGNNTTTYASTGTDTVGDLINAISNPNIAKDAQVTATLDSSGHLVITSKNTTDSVSIGGLYASNVGFGPKNDSFTPVAPTAPAASASATTSSTSTSGASSSSTSKTSTTPTANLFNSSYALQTSGTALTFLSSAGAFLNTLI
ncbi:MAG TPA: hypothetical protein VH206_07160 [Xanthobacteraceae bacterium]|jgi:hypothetical protein|nr:hypothetical protein [Xanthobacteraceae bacterium]